MKEMERKEDEKERKRQRDLRRQIDEREKEREREIILRGNEMLNDSRKRK